MALCGMLFKKLLFGVLISVVVASPETNPSCNRTCGSVSIPYPFGTSKDCCLARSFLITCNYTFDHPKPFLGTGNVEVLNISLDGDLRVSNLIARRCDNRDFKKKFNLGRFVASSKKNKFTAVGCNTVAYIEGRTAQKNFTTGCVSRCDSIGSVVNGSCDGVGCCQSSIPENITYFNVSVGTLNKDSNVQSFVPCGFGFLVEEAAYKFSSLDLSNFQNKTKVPMVLDWVVENKTCLEAQENQTSYACKAASSECYNSTNGLGYRCRCSKGYDGNPYLPGGCKDIDECKSPYPCGSGQRCINHDGGSRCVCLTGYEDGGSINAAFCKPKTSNSRIITIAL